MSLKFSERQGITSPRTQLQTGAMDIALRNSIWNCLELILWQSEGFLYRREGLEPNIVPFSRALWLSFLKLPIDTIPEHSRDIKKILRNYFFEWEWYEVYNFVEWVISHYRSSTDRHQKQLGEMLHKMMNTVLDSELAGYRIIDNVITDITDEQEIELLENALQDGRFAPVREHLKSALEKLSNRQKPDYRNSIKESISAVEAMACQVSGQPTASLGDALKVLEKEGKLHGALKKGFSALYGYTNDSDGIRHALMEESNLKAADAKYFLLSCTSFVNYLKSKI